MKGRVAARVSAVDITVGRTQYRLRGEQWYVHMWGWWPTGANPRWAWVDVAEDCVPDEVKALAKETLRG
jgi:hypothetical protein